MVRPGQGQQAQVWPARRNGLNSGLSAMETALMCPGSG